MAVSGQLRQLHPRGKSHGIYRIHDWCIPELVWTWRRIEKFSIAIFLDVIHRLTFFNETTTFRELALLPSLGENTYSVGSDRRGLSQAKDWD
jgi:hypothetical protein